MSDIATWLRTARLGQTMPSGDPWTQGELLDRMLAETGWAPARPNYSRYENGKAIPQRETLARFVDFWSRYGVAGPDLTPPAVAEPIDMQAATLALLERQALAAERTAVAAEAQARATAEIRDAISGGLARLDATASGGALGLADALGLLARALGATLPGIAAGPSGQDVRAEGAHPPHTPKGN